MSHLERQPLLLQEAHPQQSSHKPRQEEAAANRQTPLSIETKQHGASEYRSVLRDEPCGSDHLSDDGNDVDDPFLGLLVGRVPRVPHSRRQGNGTTAEGLNHSTAGNDAFDIKANELRIPFVTSVPLAWEFS